MFLNVTMDNGLFSNFCEVDFTQMHFVLWNECLQEKFSVVQVWFDPVFLIVSNVDSCEKNIKNTLHRSTI